MPFDQWVFAAIGGIFTAGGTYMAIRMDLKFLHLAVSRLETSISAAHARIDKHLEDGAHK